MPQVLYCILLVLALPQVAAAGGALGVPAEPLVAGSGPLERTAPPLVPARGLDLGIEDEQMRVSQEARDAGQDTDFPGRLVTSAPTRRIRSWALLRLRDSAAQPDRSPGAEGRRPGPDPWRPARS